MAIEWNCCLSVFMLLKGGKRSTTKLDLKNVHAQMLQPEKSLGVLIK